MAEPWIRVHANLTAKPVIGRAAESLGIKRHEAIGLLVQFWGSVSQHATNGIVRDYSDVQLEVWAGWTRKAGKFAAFIRSFHLDENGRVNEWEEYAGVLEEQRRQARDRKRKSRGSHSDICEPPHLRDETIRDDIERQLHPATAEEAEAEAGLATLLETDADRNALTAVVARSNSRMACIIALRSMLTGNDPDVPKPTPQVFGQALRDMATNGVQPTARKIRNYIADAARPSNAAPSGSGNGRGTRQTNPGAQMVANILGGPRD